MLTVLGANLLKLKPCLNLDESGALTVCKKFRGDLSKVTEEYVKYILSLPNIDYRRLFIAYTSMSKEILNNITAKVRELSDFKEVLVSKAGCVIGTHGGPNALALFYMST